MNAQFVIPIPKLLPLQEHLTFHCLLEHRIPLTTRILKAGRDFRLLSSLRHLASSISLSHPSFMTTSRNSSISFPLDFQSAAEGCGQEIGQHQPALTLSPCLYVSLLSLRLSVSIPVTSCLLALFPTLFLNGTGYKSHDFQPLTRW